MIKDSILDIIGNTPIVRINEIPKELNLQCEILAKLEYYNAGGSIKDRIAKRMIEDAEKNNILQKGSIIIEPTSGNTGIGLALCGAIKGYPVIITLPDKMSNEKINLMKSLGAQIIRTPTEASYDSPESHIGVAKKLNQDLPNSVILDQYSNVNNPLAHYESTADEIINELGDKDLDMVVIGVGTGGTLSGLGRKLKERYPKVKIVGVDPRGSILAGNSDVHSYQVEGIGYDFIPEVLNPDIVDLWVKTEDRESFEMARKIIRKEGIFCGGSTGSIFCGAIKAINHYNLVGKGNRILLLCPDSIRNYMSKFLADEWMLLHGFMEPKEYLNLQRIKEIPIQRYKIVPVKTVDSNLTMDELAIQLSQESIMPNSVIPILKNETIIGLVEMKKMAQGSFRNLHITKLMSKDFVLAQVDDDASILAYLTAGITFFLRKGDKPIIDDNLNVFTINPFSFAIS